MGAVSKRVLFFSVCLVMLGAASAGAQSRRGAILVLSPASMHRPFLYDPFWGPWYAGGYGYRDVGRTEADIRTEVTPKDTEVYVDGYYAGLASEFSGLFHRLHVAPGGHRITLHLQGFTTVTQSVYATPDSTFKMNTAMQPLAAGETTLPVPVPARRPAQAPRPLNN